MTPMPIGRTAIDVFARLVAGVLPKASGGSRGVLHPKQGRQRRARSLCPASAAGDRDESSGTQYLVERPLK
ncbi:hypothetical protein GQ55_5G026200 [Panicum hallii var. hallii]|uniref:Uncharacterized protein n=1 Tax=Panicum hallii var. hallii TaxID=1504633 RepID=A0A2T7DBW7_9POAL|nr:hypothetical protein GQ55_5G026200 [Panicum hallii var. hallii]